MARKSEAWRNMHMARTIVKDPFELEQMDPNKIKKPTDTEMEHPPMQNAQDMIQHMRDMVKEGYTNEQILQLHPEIKNYFGDDNGEDTESS